MRGTEGDRARRTAHRAPDSPSVGERAPEFFIHTRSGRMPLGELAAQVGVLAVVTIDSYRYHPG